MDVVVHGGAGSAPAHPDARLAVVEQAAQTGSEQPTPVDAVLTAVSVLETSPRLNAGIGGSVQSDGEIRTDAGIMTADRDVGAACSMAGVADAIAVADAVRTQTPHVLLAGEEAVAFADLLGIETGVDLWTDRTRSRWEDFDVASASRSEQLAAVRERFGGSSDTVGAVASDGDQVVAGTSTAGRWFALAGRVGDVPQVGSGFYASSSGGASTTGAGEDIARLTLSREVIRSLESGADPQAAAEAAVRTFRGVSDGNVGVIAMTPEGEVGAANASEAMQTSVARSGQVDRTFASRNPQ